MKPIYVYDTAGEWVATRFGDYIFDQRGEWVAWLDGKQVISIGGEYVGEFSKDQRILRKRVMKLVALRTDLPPAPEKPEMPARAPLPPMFAGLTYDTIDVLDEDPETFSRLSERRPDMD